MEMSTVAQIIVVAAAIAIIVYPIRTGRVADWVRRRRPLTETIDTLREQAFADYHAICAADGVDPETELLERTLTGGRSVGRVIADRLANAHQAGLRGHPFDRLDLVPATAMALDLPDEPYGVVISIAQASTREGRRFEPAVANSPDYPGMRRALAASNRCPARAVHRLSIDPDPTFRVAAARHMRAGHGVLHRLARDHNPTVRAAVATNTHTRVRVLHRLANDTDDTVRTTAARRLKLPALARTWIFR